MAPAPIQRVVSARGDVYSRFIAIGTRVQAIRSPRCAEGRPEKSARLSASMRKLVSPDQIRNLFRRGRPVDQVALHLVAVKFQQ